MIRRMRRRLNEALLSNEDLLSILPDKIVKESILKGKVIIVRGINIDQCANIIMKDGWRYQSNRSIPGYAIYTKTGNSIVVYSDDAYSSTIQSVADNETMQKGIAYSRKSKYPKLTFSKFWKQYNAEGFPDEEIIDAQDEILNILKSVETDEPGRFVDDYPHIKAAFANLSKSQSDEISKIWHNAMYESYEYRNMMNESVSNDYARYLKKVDGLSNRDIKLIADFLEEYLDNGSTLCVDFEDYNSAEYFKSPRELVDIINGILGDPTLEIQPNSARLSEAYRTQSVELIVIDSSYRGPHSSGPVKLSLKIAAIL